MKIGVISDTHGFLDPRVPSCFKGVEHILHGGDIGPASLIVSLERIAPVTAVLGNTDAGIDFRETELVELGGLKFLVHHIVDALNPQALLGSLLERHQPDVVVFGHTHQPHDKIVEGRRLFNPGYAGKPRFSMPRSVAILHFESAGVRAEFIPLS